MIISRTIYPILLFLSLLLPMALHAQLPMPQDMKVSVEPPPGDNVPQYWPGIFLHSGKLYVTWGESRLVDSNSFPEIWYTLAGWSPRSTPPVQIVASKKSDSIVLAPGSSQKRVSIGRSERPLSFSAGYLVGSVNYRGDITPPPLDTVFRSLYALYFVQDGEWKRVTIDERQRSSRDIFVNQRGYGYDPSRREVLCAWTLGSSRTGAEPLGTVTAVNAAGAITWSAEGIPLKGQKVNLIPIGEREFLTIIDSVAIHYRNGARQDSFLLPAPHRQNTLYQRLLGDVFVRGYLVADESKHVLEMYGFDGTLQRTLDITGIGPDANYYVAQEERSKALGLVTTGPEGVFATIYADDFTEVSPKLKVSRGLDSASSPIATFREDTLFIAWQDTRNGEFDVYGVAYRYRESDLGVGDEAGPSGTLDMGTVYPNPANKTTRVMLTLPYSSVVDLEIVDASGAVVRREEGRALAQGDQEIPIALDGLAPGSYTIVARAGALRATGTLVLVR